MSGYYVIYKGSSAAEDTLSKGATHLVEHLICRRLEPLVRELNLFAVKFNATTSDDYICFYILGLEEFIDKYTVQLHQRLKQSMVFSQEEFETEKQIVMREINSKHIHPVTQTIYQIMEENLGYSGPAGTISSVKSLTLSQVQRLFERQFKEPYMTIRIGNHFQYRCLEKGLHHTLAPRVSLKDLPQHIQLKKPISENLFISISPVIPNSALPFSQIVNYLLCGTFDSPLYKKIREELQLCYSIEVTYFPFGDYHINYISSFIPVNKMSVVKEEISLILRDSSFLTSENINRAISYFRILARMHETHRYSDIRHLLCNTIYAKTRLDSIFTEDILKHYDNYYINGFAY